MTGRDRLKETRMEESVGRFMRSVENFAKNMPHGTGAGNEVL